MFFSSASKRDLSIEKLGWSQARVNYRREFNFDFNKLARFVQNGLIKKQIYFIKG